MATKIFDTNVPLTAAGFNDEASKDCQLRCVILLGKVLSGEIQIVIDARYEVLDEYSRRIHAKYRGSLAEQFMLYMLRFQVMSDRVHCVDLAKNSDGTYNDYPDNDGDWTSEIPRCERFDPDDKKWVALALRFKRDTGEDASIVNAADRCWLAFEPHLQAAGVKLECLCREERESASA